jgi:hypothetical protein
MKAKLVIYLILLSLIVAVAWFVVRQQPKKVQRIRNTRVAWQQPAAFDRNVKAVKYTRHAKCRMDCRQISEEEVKEILKEGTINGDKTDLKDRPCPTYALEGYTRQDRQHVRIVFAQCETETRVVTCIDLDREFPCHCN